MKLTAFRIIQCALCVAAGILLTVIELQFFEGTAALSAPFLIILAVTVSAVFLYALSVNGGVLIIIYAVCLTFVLAVFGREISAAVLLASLLVPILMLAQKRLRQNAERSREKRPAFALSFFTLLICVCIAAFSAFQIYTYLLKPYLPESEKYALLTNLTMPEEATPPEQEQPMLDSETVSRDEADDPGEIAPPRPSDEPVALPIALFIAAIIVLVITAAALYKYYKYRKWLKATLASPLERQIFEFYMYFLRSLAICGHPRKTGDTPLEYLKNACSDGFPLPVGDFGEITTAFVAVRYGEAEVTPAVQDSVIALFKALPSCVKASRGRKFYYLSYIRKMHIQKAGD